MKRKFYRSMEKSEKKIEILKMILKNDKISKILSKN